MKSISIANNALYAITSDGNHLYTGGMDKIVGKWNKNLSPAPPNVRTDAAIYQLAIDDYERLWIGLSNSSLHIIDLKAKKELKNIIQHKKSIYKIIHLKNGKSISSDGTGALAIWDTYSFELERFIPFSSTKIRSVQKTENGYLLADGSGKIFLCDEWFNVKHEAQQQEKACNTVLSFGNCIYSSGWDGHLYQWNQKLELIRKIPAHTGAIYQLVEKDGFIYSASRDGSIKKWDKKLKFTGKLELHPSKRSINAICLHQGFLFAVSDRPYLYQIDLSQDFQ